MLCQVNARAGHAAFLWPFSGLNGPQGAAVDGAGNVYVVEWQDNRVLKLAPGSSTATELPFPGLKNPYGLAVDTAGSVYVADARPRSRAEVGGRSEQLERSAGHRP
jgi:serine/threonine protein kinase, bacterial